MATNVEYYRTINSINEKVELRAYSSGIVRCYIFQGGRWSPMEMELFWKYKNRGVIIEDS
jgi:hypothetical protein